MCPHCSWFMWDGNVVLRPAISRCHLWWYSQNLTLNNSIVSLAPATVVCHESDYRYMASHWSHNIIIFLKLTPLIHAHYLLKFMDPCRFRLWCPPVPVIPPWVIHLTLIQGIFCGIVARKSQVFRTDVIRRRYRNNRRQRQQAGEQNTGLALCLPKLAPSFLFPLYLSLFIFI